MLHEILTVGPLACNCSIFGDEQTREAIVVDPGDDIADIQAVLDRHRLRTAAIVITHAHVDHIGAAAQLKAATGATVWMHPADTELARHIATQAAWLGIPAPEIPGIDSLAREGDTLRLGGVEFQILHTPGHSPGSISLWIPGENKVLAGDTLFRESIGRTDLPGGDPRQILRSIHDKLMPLADDAIVVPGHGELTTIGYEKRHNYFLKGF